MASISDIAKRAGVSVSTVSHVVNGTRYVSPEKEEKVRKAIEEMEKADQLPNFIVKKKRQGSDLSQEGKEMPVAKATGQEYVLILLSEQNSLFQTQVRKNLEQLFRESGIVSIAVCYDQNPERLERIRTLLTSTRDLDGIIAFPDSLGILRKNFFEPLRVPIVLIGNYIQGLDTDVFLPDTYEAGYKAVEHLVKNGHEKIAFLCEAEELSAHRYGGYQKALEDYGISVDNQIIYSSLRTEKEVFDAMRKITDGTSGTTALIVSDSYPLIPVFRYLNARNIIVPRDLSVVSLNEFDWAPLLSPELTCVDKQPREFAKEAVSVLMSRIEKKQNAGNPDLKEEYLDKKLGARLKIRSSTSGIGRGPFGEKAESVDTLTLSEVDKEIIRQKKYTAAISFHYTGKAWMQLQEKGIRKIFDDLGISIIMVTDAHFDAEMQCRQLESIKILKPDILISIPVDTKKTSAAFRSIIDSGIKLVLITNIPEGLTPADYVSCISVNEHSHGSCMGRGLGEYMHSHGLKNAGIFRHGIRDFFATRQRDNAAELTLSEEYPDINICGYVDFISEEDVYKKTFAFLAQHPETEAIYVSWDGPALKAVEALAEAGRTDIAVVTGDLDYAVALNMARGGAVKMISAQCPYEQGEAIALAAANGMLNRSIPSFVGVEPISIKQENLLKNWKTIFREGPPVELKKALSQSDDTESNTY